MSDEGGTVIPPQTYVECEECGGSVDVSWFCKNCPSSLCGKCAREHKSKRQCKSHSVVPRTYTVLRLYGPAKIAEQCQIHPEKDISAYCNECNAPCCISCLSKDHKHHDFSTIEDKYLDVERSLNDYVRKLDTDVRPMLDRMEEQVRANVKEDDIHVEKVINDINDYRKEVVQNFNRACDDLIDQVRKILSKNSDGLREIEKSKEYLESLNREIEEIVQKGNLDLMKYVPPKLESLVPQLKGPQKEVPSFEPAREVLDVIKSVGKIHFKDIKNKEKDMISSMGSLHVQKLNSFKSELYVSSITKADNNMAWVMHFGIDTMYLYDDMGKVVRSVTVEGSKGINDMAITQLGEMIVTCMDKKVRRVSVSGKVSTVMDTAPFGCYGMCLTEKEEIVVCMRDRGDEDHVAVYSHDGRSRLREIRGEDGQGKQSITYPYRVVQNGDNLCVVDDDYVVSVDERGYVRWVYDGKQAKLGRSFDPCGICVDRYHNLLVIDNNNHCVHYIDREGRLIQVILTQKQTGLQYPGGICVDHANGQVWMGSGTRNVVISKYLA